MKNFSLFLITFILNYSICNAQKNNFLVGKVIKYTKVHNYTHTSIDTITGQYRSLTIDTLTKKIWIQWVIVTEKIAIDYNIRKISNTVNYNQTTKKNGTFVDYLTYDDEGYPLLIKVSTDFKIIYLYYFWSNIENGFVKSEKIEVTQCETISL